MHAQIHAHVRTLVDSNLDIDLHYCRTRDIDVEDLVKQAWEFAQALLLLEGARGRSKISHMIHR